MAMLNYEGSKTSAGSKTNNGQQRLPTSATNAIKTGNTTNLVNQMNSVDKMKQQRADNLAYKNALNANKNPNPSTNPTTPTYTTPTTSTTTTTSTADSGSSDNYGDYLKSYYESLIASINAQKQEKERLAEAKYQSLLKQADDNYNNSINQITKNNAYTNRWLKQNYGGASGLGLSNSLRANTNYENNLYSALQSLNEAKLNAETDKYNNQAEATNEYLQNYNNYITSPMSNVLSAMSKSSIDDGSYKKYINKLFGI